ncbi:MAG: HAF repeat-containing protein [Thermodesulfobacteriota bacterium]
MNAFRLPRLLVFGAIVLCLPAAPARAQMTDLGTLGGNNSRANCINDNGEVVGWEVDTSGRYRARYWYRGGITDLGTPEGDTSRGQGINNQSWVVGDTGTSSSQMGIFAVHCQNNIPEPSTFTIVDDPPQGSSSHVSAINNSSNKYIVSTSYDKDGRMSARFHYVYSPKNNPSGGMSEANGGITELGTLGGANSEATGLNDLNQVVGSAETADGEEHAFLYTGTPGVDGAMHDLGTLGGNRSKAYGINNLGHVVGSSLTAQWAEHAFLYTGVPGAGGAMTDLGTFGGTRSQARDINDLGQIVGSYSTASGRIHAFLYTNGVVRDLGVLPGGTDSWAYSINNLGQVVGEATTAAGYRAFLYNPPQALAPALMLLLSEWLRPFTGWGRPPSLALPPAAGLGGMGGDIFSRKGAKDAKRG